MISQTADCGQLQEGTASGNIVVMPIENMILSIRGQQVILDRDLARLYQVETSQMNRQVKRNIERFPDDFRFQLTKEEFDSLKCQNGISNRGGDRRELPYAKDLGKRWCAFSRMEILTPDELIERLPR